MRTLISLPYYRSQNSERNSEMDYCLNKNLMNLEINNILLISQENYEHIPKDPKIIKIIKKERPKYSDFIDFYNKSDFDLLIIINSDIFILESDIKLIKESINDDAVYALSRWDIKKEGSVEHHDNWGSQDTWVIKGKVNSGKYDIELGKPGCDNRIAYLFKKSGYNIKNPSKEIRTYHYHLSNYRTYDSEIDRVKGKYFYVNPTRINEQD